MHETLEGPVRIFRSGLSERASGTTRVRDSWRQDSQPHAPPLLSRIPAPSARERPTLPPNRYPVESFVRASRRRARPDRMPPRRFASRISSRVRFDARFPRRRSRSRTHRSRCARALQPKQYRPPVARGFRSHRSQIRSGTANARRTAAGSPTAKDAALVTHDPGAGRKTASASPRVSAQHAATSRSARTSNQRTGVTGRVPR